jgi:hypothetical protein
MAELARIPRRRGGLCGLLLILLGAWGALIPFIGPYFKFAYTPDKAWAYTSGRLYLSILPGAAAAAGGLLVLVTRSRAAGMFGGLLAAAGGAWFIAGAGIVGTVLNQRSIAPGAPLAHGAAGISSSAKWMFLEEIGFFTGVGILVIFFGAIAIGRFSMLSARDAARADSGDDYSDDSHDSADEATSAPATTAAGQFPAGPRPFPGDEPTQTQDQFPASPSGQYPESTSPFGTKSE